MKGSCPQNIYQVWQNSTKSIDPTARNVVYTSLTSFEDSIQNRIKGIPCSTHFIVNCNLYFNFILHLQVINSKKKAKKKSYTNSGTVRSMICFDLSINFQLVAQFRHIHLNERIGTHSFNGYRMTLDISPHNRSKSDSPISLSGRFLKPSNRITAYSDHPIELNLVESF